MMSRQNNEKLYILIKIFLLCFCWTFISFGVESFCVWFEVETNELHLIIEFILQYFLTYGGIKRYTSSSSSKKCMDNEAIFIITIFSILFFIIAIYRTSKEMPLYADEIVGYLITEFVLVALIEELVFREIVSSMLIDFKKITKILCSALIFTTMHYVSWMPEIIAFDITETSMRLFSPLCIGIILATLYEIHKSIFLTVIVHGTYNVLTLISYGNIRIVICLCYILFAIIYCIYFYRKEKINEKINAFNSHSCNDVKRNE